MKPWEGKHWLELHQQIRSKSKPTNEEAVNALCDLELALVKDWEENYEERCRFYAMEAGSHVRLSDEITGNKAAEE